MNVALKEFFVTPDKTSANAGAVSFNVTNTGTTAHNFRIIKTELAADQLPVANNHVDETKVDIIAKSPTDITAGTSQTVSATLVPGNYVLICNVVGHYKIGMHVAFTVNAAAQ